MTSRLRHFGRLPQTCQDAIATDCSHTVRSFTTAVSRLHRLVTRSNETASRDRNVRRDHQTRRAYAQQTSTSHSSVNADEVAHFNKLAASWWDPEGSSRLLHLMNPVRHRFLQKCFQHGAPAQTTGLRYLDIGCGGGIFAESAARLRSTASVTAIDPTPEVLRIARQHQRQDPLLLEPGRLNYVNTTIEELDVPTNVQDGYDVVSLFEVVEHIQDPAPFLETAMQHVKPGGWLVGSTIARTALSWFTTKLVAEDIIRLVPRGTHDWSQYIQPDELQAWAKKQPLVEQASTRIQGVVYVPGFGWREVQGSEQLGNYFFAFRRTT